jgi:hypothetical protein
MPSCVNLPTGYSPGGFHGYIMRYPFYDLYSHEPSEDELALMILEYEFEHKTNEGRMCVISFSLPGFSISKV